MKISYAPFWETLQKKGISQYTLIHQMNVRTSLLDKLRHDSDIRLSTLGDLCEILDCRVEDIVKMVPENEKVEIK